MTLLAPWFLAAGAIAAAAVVALHFLAWGRPPELLLPTARFVPDRPARAAARATTPADLILLTLRVLLVMLVALALAGPVRSASGRGVRRLILADVSSAVLAPADVRDSVRAIAREGDVVIAFDTLARVIDRADSLSFDAAPRAGGALSVALVAALRAAPRLRARAESIELVIVSPLTASELDAATSPLRALWRGRARVARVRPAAPQREGAVEIVSARGSAVASDDPVLAAVGLLSRAGEGATARVVRGTPGAEDREWAMAAGRVLVEWPRDSAPSGWRSRESADSAGAVVAGAAVAMGPFARRWRADASLRESRVVARWPDGEVAATESSLGDGCLRQVAFNPSDAGDAAIRPGFLAVVAALVAPCGDALGPPVSPADAARLAGGGALLASSGLAPVSGRRSTLAPWLFGMALVVLAAEHALRDRGRAA